MNGCPQCGGLLIQDDGSEDFLLEPLDDFYCPGCGWSTGDEVTETDEEDDERDYPQQYADSNDDDLIY